MKITKEYYIDFLIKLKKESTYHDDYIKLNLEKLYLLNNYLKIDNLIEYDFQMKSFNLKPFETSLYDDLNVKSKKYDRELNRGSILNGLVYYFNTLMDKLTFNSKMDETYMCTNNENEYVLSELMIRENDKIITSHQKQIDDIYKNTLINILLAIYGFSIYSTKEDVSFINFNVKITDLEDINKLQESIDDSDYF